MRGGGLHIYTWRESMRAVYNRNMTAQQKTILIIEDDLTQLHALETTFQNEGYAVRTAENGREGFEKAKAEMPDIILLDIIMPVMDGIAALEKINTDPATTHIPVIVLTNFALYEKIQPFMHPDKDLFLTKINAPLKDIVLKVNTILS